MSRQDLSISLYVLVCMCTEFICRKHTLYSFIGLNSTIFYATDYGTQLTGIQK